MLRALAGYRGFLENIGFCFLLVAWQAKQLQCTFSVFAAIDKRDFMIDGSWQFCADRAGAECANPAAPFENANPNARRYCLIVIAPNPFINISSHRETPRRFQRPRRG